MIQSFRNSKFCTSDY